MQHHSVLVCDLAAVVVTATLLAAGKWILETRVAIPLRIHLH